MVCQHSNVHCHWATEGMYQLWKKCTSGLKCETRTNVLIVTRSRPIGLTINQLVQRYVCISPSDPYASLP